MQAREARELADTDVSDGTVLVKLRSEDITSPVDLYRREHSEEEKRAIRELCEVGDLNPDSPVTLSDFVKLSSRVNELKLDEQENNRNQSDRLLQAMGDKPPAAVIEDFEKQFKSMRWKVNVIWAVLVLALTAAGGSTIAAAKWLRESGKNELQEQLLIEHDKDHEIRIRRVEDTANQNSSRINDHLTGHRGRNLTPEPAASKLDPP